MNKYIALARLGRDAEVRQAGQTTVANFPAAVDVGFGDNKSTLWLDCALFGKRAEGALVQYLTKGTQIVVEGEINLRQYQKQDGTYGAAVTLKVQDLTLVGGQSEGGQKSQQPQRQQPAQNQQPQGPAQSNTPEPIDDFEDIPF
jgi:single-strand DNA-binding protein